jgi:predicted flap endonuclease-1-like 5' DNA nuclease
MQDLVTAYWMWFVVALLVGGVVGYWLLRRLGPQGGRAAGVGSAPPEAAALAERTRAAVKSAQDEAVVSAGTIEDARLAVEAKAAEVTRIAADAKAAEDARLAVEAKAAEEARIAAVAKAAEDARLAVEAKAAEVTRIAAAAKAAEEARFTDESRAAEAARVAAAAKLAEEGRLAAEAKAAEEARISAAAKAAEEVRLAAEVKAAKKARTAATDNKVDADARLVAQTRIRAAAREAAAMMASDPGVAATAAVAAAGISHPGSKPAGIAAPGEGGVDDLKLIRGIGPRNEKACNALGVYQFRQIADWTPDEAVWVGHHMAFPGRIEREHWIAQARLLASGGETEHARAVKSGSLVVDETADAPLDQASAEVIARSLPEQAPTVEGEDKHAGRRPYGFASAVGAPDDLKKIRGIGPQNERRLHALGIWHFSQIAAWSEDNVKWVGSYLAFAGRIDREKWVAQARDLVAGKGTELSHRVAAGKAATSKDDGASG